MTTLRPEWIRSVRYGSVKKKLKANDAVTAEADTGDAATDGCCCDDHQHQQQRCVGTSQPVAKGHQRRRHADRQRCESCAGDDRLARHRSAAVRPS